MDRLTPQRVVVMTGGTAGLGAHASQRIAVYAGTRVLVGARGSGTVPRRAEVLPLDLASLTGVRACADTVTRQLGDARIDTRGPNAGMRASGADGRSADGCELTFAVWRGGQRGARGRGRMACERHP